MGALCVGRRGRLVMADKIVKQGYLMKKGAKRKNWTNRWFVLRGNQLEYYKDPIDLKPRGTIQLTGSTVGLSDSKPHTFTIDTESRVFLISAKNSTLRDQWIAAIKDCVK